MRPRTLLAAISPCPNDTFIFQPWAEGAVASPFSISLSFHDIETLNILSQTSAPYDITKVSTACLNAIGDDYIPLASGAAFAMNGGPKLVSRRHFEIRDLRAARISIPGRNTSAFVALCILYGHPENIVEMPSSEVLKSVADGRVDAGLVIHEARFVYPSYGLRQVVDIGDAYNARFRMPLPLGVIAAKRSLGDEVLDCLSHTLHRSICHAKTSSSLSSFVSSRATEMHSTTIWQHINHFVTRETEMMADEEFRWIQCFLEAAKGVA